ncbi:tyrosine-type recombinase/integrase [Amycolatopsis echigonensis]|uniref:tyrosine-type recombinase/integrase n=2 Tax=Amycolatopsis TaxID=1813 RepID=UPI0028B0F017|nr:tyrosine-type recombinase/integrase [Amycolatopsis echigonensis]
MGGGADRAVPRLRGRPPALPVVPSDRVCGVAALRRGEACGQRRSDTFLDAGCLEVANQIVQYGWETGQSKPKTPSSEGIVPLDPDTVLVLAAHLARQDEAKTRLGSDWREHDLLFTCPDGSPLHPADVADEFARLIVMAGLPPITLHGLRHGAATLMLAAGVEMKVIQHILRHSSIKVTMDLYTNVAQELAADGARRLAGAIPRQAALRPASVLGLPRARRRPQWTVENRKNNVRITQNPRSSFPTTWGVRVRHQGLEPRTRWLRVTYRVVPSDVGQGRFPQCGCVAGVGRCRGLSSCFCALGLPSGSQVLGCVGRPGGLRAVVLPVVGARCRGGAVMGETGSGVAPNLALWVQCACTGLVAVGAAYASYRHGREFALRFGADMSTASIWPLLVDGLLTIATVELWKKRKVGRERGRWVAWSAFVFGIGLSLLANVGSAPVASPLQVVVAACPPVALLFAVELLNRALKQRNFETCSETVCERGETETVAGRRGTGTMPAGRGAVAEGLGGEGVLTAEERMWVHYSEQVAVGRSPSGAELDRVAGTHNYGRRVLRRWRRSGRVATVAADSGKAEESAADALLAAG